MTVNTHMTRNQYDNDMFTDNSKADIHLIYLQIKRGFEFTNKKESEYDEFEQIVNLLFLNRQRI